MKRPLYCLILLLLWQGSAAAQDKSAILLGINDGISVQQYFGDLQQKYQGLASYLSRVLKKPVHFESSQTLERAASNLGKMRYDLMFVKPSNVAAKAIRDDKYALVATCKGQLNTVFIVAKNSSIKKPEDIRGKRIAMPTPLSLMAQAAMATLRDMGIDPAKQNIQHARLQEAVVYMVAQGFADVGVVNPGLAKDWAKQGGTILFKSKNLPLWSVIASPSMSQDDVAKVRKALVTLGDTEEGRKVLAQIGVKGFILGNPDDYVNMLTWMHK